MAISPFFNNNPDRPTNDQLLMEDMINEQIYIMGHDVYYILRETADEIDWVLGEDPTSIFKRAYKIAVFINDRENWTDGSESYGKFGYFINKQNSVVITRRIFNKFVGNAFREKPTEGDLIYIPVFEKLFEIKKVSKEGNFYSQGRRDAYYYTVDIEMFKYNHEPIDTGIDELDILEPENAYVIEMHVNSTAIPYWVNEIVYQGANLVAASCTAQVKYWDQANSIVGIYNIAGQFANGEYLKGDSSTANAMIIGFDDLENNEEYRSYTNVDLQSEANVYIDTSETNPFGSV